MSKNNVIHNNASLGQSVKDHLTKFFAMHDNIEPSTGLYIKVISEVEKVLIAETLCYVGNIQSKAAKILGINRNTLSKKIQEYKLNH